MLSPLTSVVLAPAKPVEPVAASVPAAGLRTSLKATAVVCLCGLCRRTSLLLAGFKNRIFLLLNRATIFFLLQANLKHNVHTNTREMLLDLFNYLDFKET